jgi:tetratricopeptide (TPR) repeat protein
MKLRSLRCAAGTLFVLLAGTASAALAQEDPKKEAEAWVKLAAPAVRKGDWESAKPQLEKARAADPANAEAGLLLARIAERTGDLPKAIEIVSSLPPDARTLTRKAELLLARGDAAGAETAAREAMKLDETSLPARRILGEVLAETGRRDAAVEAWVELNRLWAKHDGTDTDETLLAVARARLGVYRISTEYRQDLNFVVSRFEELLKRPEPPEEAYLEAGDLYLEALKDIEAKKWFTKATDMNPRSAEAIFGLAKQLAYRFDDIGAQKEAERALKENPAYVPALLFQAQIALGDGSYDKAEEALAKALRVNPDDAEARGTRAALHFLRGAQGAFDAEVKAILARNKYASAPYRILAHVLEEQRRFAEALDYAERACMADPMDFDAAFVAGRNAMNVGDDAKAEKLLRDAEKNDPFPNLYRRNFLTLYSALAKFPTVKSGRFEMRLSREIEDAYTPLVTQEMEASLATLEKRWGFRAETPIYVSIFDRQEDFATRTIGLPGFPALGACFGRVVTLDSPRALPPGMFGWRGTLHHELAHVITLQLSKGRVPRWLTEGASVYEERKVSPVWNREAERDLVNAIASGEVLTLADINNAFRGPRVMYAYYQGGLMCEWVERDFGFPKLRELVRLYGEGFDTPEVVKRALGIEPAEFDQRFLAYAKDYVAKLRVLPVPSGESVAKLRTRLRKDKDDAAGWALLATGQAARGDTAAALQSIGRLAELVPGSGRAATLRALLAFRQKRPDQAIVFAKEAFEKDDTYDLRMATAAYALEQKDFAAAKSHLVRAIELFPLAGDQNSPRLKLAELLLGEGETKLDEAMKLQEDHVRIAEDDFVVRMKLAGFYRDRGRADDELRTLLEIRDVTPLPNGDWNREACASLHERTATLQMERKDWPAAELSSRMAVSVSAMSLRPNEAPPLADGRRAELLTLHAEALHLLGRDDEARRRADEALRLDPGNEKAGELSEKLKP